ncbi:MAG: hypothetical protein ISS01_03200 [Nanoarchaeota archaeon]|nr:hypothetical protein [Nanoarchaeota archaeon]
MNKETIYRRIQREREKVLKNTTDSFINDYEKYGYTLLEVFDRILSRELKNIIVKNRIHGDVKKSCQKE